MFVKCLHCVDIFFLLWYTKPMLRQKENGKTKYISIQSNPLARIISMDKTYSHTSNASERTHTKAHLISFGIGLRFNLLRLSNYPLLCYLFLLFSSSFFFFFFHLISYTCTHSTMLFLSKLPLFPCVHARSCACAFSFFYNWFSVLIWCLNKNKSILL